MNTTELIEIARECCSYPVKVSDYHWCREGEFIFTEAGLNAFAQRIQPQWQPIETAPDETEVFVAIPKYNNASEHGYVLACAICIDGQWISTDDELFIYDPDFWMPLPQPPESKP